VVKTQPNNHGVGPVWRVRRIDLTPGRTPVSRKKNADGKRKKEGGGGGGGDHCRTWGKHQDGRGEGQEKSYKRKEYLGVNFRREELKKTAKRGGKVLRGFRCNPWLCGGKKDNR